MRGLFITGTDTDVGKTYVTAAIARQLRAGGWRPGACKPVCSGAEPGHTGEPRWNDVEVLAAAIGIENRSLICSQCFRAPLAPPVAAHQEGTTVSWQRMLDGVTAWQNAVDAPDIDLLLIEGVGGLLCPLTEQHTVADFAVAVAFPVIIVARLGLGTINHTLLTIESAQARGLTIAGVILNDGQGLAETPAGRSNFDQLNQRIEVPLLGVFPFGDDTIRLRDGRTSARMDWQQLAQCR